MIKSGTTTPRGVTTTVKKKMLLELLEKNLGIIAPSIKTLGINRMTYYNWVKKDKKFRDAVESIKETSIDFVESKLYKSIDEGNVTAMIFYLKCRAKNRGYIEHSNLDITIRPIDFKFGEGDNPKLLE